jgi:hypothetical protein
MGVAGETQEQEIFAGDLDDEEMVVRAVPRALHLQGCQSGSPEQLLRLGNGCVLRVHERPSDRMEIRMGTTISVNPNRFDAKGAACHTPSLLIDPTHGSSE